MNSTGAAWLQYALLFAALAACYVPLGNYIAHIFTTKKHWRVERGIYKLCGIDPEADMRWSVYVRSVLAFSFISVLFLPVHADTALAVPVDRDGQRHAGYRVEHRRLVHHQHQLAELRR